MSRRIITIAAVAVGLTLAVLTYFAPQIASSAWGQARLAAWINGRIPGKIEFTQLELGWSGRQLIQDFALFDEHGEKILSFDRLQTDTPLLQLFREGPSLGKTELVSLNAKIIQEEPGRTNIQSALGYTSKTAHRSHKAKKERSSALPFTGEIALQQGAIVLNPLDRQAVSLSDVNALFKIPTLDGPVHIKFSGFTKQGDISGNFDVEAAFHNFDLDGFANISDNALALLSPNVPGSLLLKAHIQNLPVDALDQILSLQYLQMSGVLYAGLGETLNVTLDEIASPEGTTLLLQVDSPHLHADFEGIATEEIMALQTKGETQWTITPAFVQLLANNSIPWQLAEPTTGKLTVTQLEIPLDGFYPENFAVQAKFDLGKTLLPGQGQPGLQINYLTAEFDAQKGKPAMILTLQGEAEQTGQSFGVDLTANLKKDSLSLHGEKDVHFAVNKLPTSILDTLLPNKSSLYLGKYLTAQAILRSDGNKSELDAKIESERLQIPRIAFLLDKEIALKETAQGAIGIDSTLLPAGWPVRGTIPVQFELKKLLVPLYNGFDPLRTIVQADWSAAAPILLRDLPQVGALEITKLSGSLGGPCLAEAECTLVAQIDSSERYPYLHHVLGNQLTTQAVAKVNVQTDGTCRWEECKLDVKSQHLLAKLKGRIQENEKLTLLSPLTMHYTLTPAAAEALGWKATNASISDVAQITFVIKPPEQPVSWNDWGQQKYSGDLRCDHLALAVGEFSPLVYLQEVSAPWTCDFQHQIFDLTFCGKNHVAFQNVSGNFSGSAKVANRETESSGSINASITRFPSEALELLTGSEDLAQFLGALLDVELKASSPSLAKKQGNLDLVIHGKQLEGSGAFEWNHEDVQLANTPLDLRFTMTPDRFSALRRMLDKASKQSHDLALLEPAQVGLELKQLRIPLLKDNYAHASAEGSLTIDRLALHDQTDEQDFTFEQVKLQVQAPDIAQKVEFSFDTQTLDKGESHPIHLSGTLIDVLNVDGKTNWETMTADVDLSFKDLPTRIMGKLFWLDASTYQKIEVLFGDKLSMNSKAELKSLNGTVSAQVNGKNGRVVLDGKLVEGVLNLDKPFEAEFTITPNMGKVVLANVMPFLSGVQSADQPLKLTVMPEGFAVPILEPLSAKTQIPNVKMEMGKVVFTKSGHLGTILNLLAKDSQEQFSVWLTPLYLEVRDGVVNVKRIDMLVADHYPIAAWGKVDLPKEKLDMLIGLTPRALYNAFHITKLEDNFLLQIPLKGGLRNASIDKNKATARISALMVQSQGTTEGLMLSTLLHVAGGTLLDEAPPTPTTEPLPWATTVAEQPAEEVGKTEETSKNPLKRLEKGASSLLKKLFGK